MSSADEIPNLAPLATQMDNADFSGCFEGIRFEDAALVEKALIAAASYAVTPISGFKVGALAFGSSGKVYIGANMEFTGAPLNASLHAEQSAIINAWMHGEPVINTLVVSETPCGHCRQFLLELTNAVNLSIKVKDRTDRLINLIPQPFECMHSRGYGLLDSPAQRLAGIRPAQNESEQLAINAASYSYTPYTDSPEGFLIESVKGSYFAGRAVESVAFNPSVPAVITALNQKNLSAHRNESISRCTHAKLATAPEHIFYYADAIMRGMCSLPINRVLMEPL